MILLIVTHHLNKKKLIKRIFIEIIRAKVDRPDFKYYGTTHKN